MRTFALVALVPIALGGGGCQPDHEGDDYPIGQGGAGPIAEGSGSSTAPNDGGVTDGELQIKGRVCLIDDLRTPTACNAGLNAMGLEVRLGTTFEASQRTTTTDALGAFTITAPLGGGYTWRVNSGNQQRIVPTVMPFGTETIIPVIGLARYNELLSSNGSQLGQDSGSIVLRLVHGTTSVAGITAQDINGVTARYDSTDDDIWNLGAATGAAGGVWFPSIPVPVTLTPVTVTLVRPTAPNVTAQALIEEGAITFVTKDLRAP